MILSQPPPLPTTTMREVVQAILRTARDFAWPYPIQSFGYRTAMSGLDPDTTLVTPAIILTVGARETGPKSLMTPGRIPRRCRFSLHGVLSTETPDVQIELLELAEAIYSLVEARDPPGTPGRGNRWGLAGAVEYPEDLTEEDTGFYGAGLHGIDGRVVSWSQIVYLREAVWPSP